MRLIGVGCLLISFAGLTGCASAPSVRPATSSLALVGVNVVDIERGRVLRDQTVMTRGERIVRVGPRKSTAIPPDVRSLELTGHYVIPGLWDMHVHLTDAEALGVYLSYGVTGVRDMAAGMFVEPERVRAWKSEIANGERIGPQIVRAGPLFDGAEAYYPGTVVMKKPAEAATAVAAARRAGADFIKVLRGLSAEVFAEIVAQASAHQMGIAGHVPRAVGVRAAAQAKMRSMEHLMGVPLACSREEESIEKAYGELATESDPERRSARARALQHRMIESYDERKGRALFALFIEKQAWQVPTLKGWHFDLWGQGTDLPKSAWTLVPKRHQGEWQQALEDRAQATDAQRQLSTAHFELFKTITRQMQQSGVGLLAGTDTPHTMVVPGLGLHHELELLVQSGLSPAEALAAATIQPALFFGIDDTHGRIAPGNAADLLILHGDPLEDIRNTQSIVSVLRKGRWYSGDDLEGLRAAARAAYGSPGD